MRYKYIAIFIIILFTGLLGETQVCAKDGSGTEEVRYKVDENSHYPMTVNVGPGGTVMDGDEKIRDSTMVYEMRIGISKEFTIMADKGWKLADITYETSAKGGTQSLLKQYEQDGKLVIQPETAEMYLHITFEKSGVMEDTKEEKPIAHPDVHENVLTGVVKQTQIFYGMLIISMISMLAIILKRKKAKKDM